MPENKQKAALPDTEKIHGPARKRLFWIIIPILWLVLLGSAEAGLRFAGVGYSPSLFDVVGPGLAVDNSDYTRRFYAAGDSPVPVQKSNLFPFEKRPGRLRVFVVGGSTAQGFPFQRNHSFTAIAQAALEAANIDVEVINLGNSAMTSYYVREALTDLRRLDPDMVVIYAGHNEYYGTPSSFTGGTHLTRLALLELRRLRMVQLMENALSPFLADGREPSQTLMEQRFSEALFPPDSARDARVADLFVRNLSAGLEPLLEQGVAAVVYRPVSNLVGMPPFRAANPEGEPTTGATPADPLEGYRRLQSLLEQGLWDREAWERVKDQDLVPFRARSVLVQRLEEYARAESRITWLDTAAEFQARGGPAAFGDSLFIDHLHLNFDGQILLARMLAEAVVKRFYFGDPGILASVATHLEDRVRIRQDIHLTHYWEFEAYTRIAALQTQEPFASMPLLRPSPRIPDPVMQNRLFQGGGFLDSLTVAGEDEMLFVALDHYRALGDREEWIANMNAYVHLFAGHYQSNLAYGVALLEDDAVAHFDAAGAYFRRAYSLSGYDPEISEVARETLDSVGLSNMWESFRTQYLEE